MNPRAERELRGDLLCYSSSLPRRRTKAQYFLEDFCGNDPAFLLFLTRERHMLASLEVDMSLRQRRKDSTAWFWRLLVKSTINPTRPTDS